MIKSYKAKEKDDFPLTTGIYLISFSNSESQKVYIGIAGQGKDDSKKKKKIGFRARWMNHLQRLRKGRHSKKFQNAYNKYGEENMYFEIIVECEPSDPDNLEQFFINEFDSHKNGYNSRPASKNMAGFKHSEESKIAMSVHRRKRRDLIKDKVISLYASGLNLNEVGKEVGLAAPSIRKILNENYFKIRGAQDFISIQMIQYNKNGEKIKVWNSMKACCGEFKISTNRMIRILKREVIHEKDLHFSREDLSSEECRNQIEQTQREMSIRRSEGVKRGHITRKTQ